MTDIVIPFEKRLDADYELAIHEGGRHFHKTNSVFETLFRTVAVLESEGVAYALYGDLAMFYHGFRRFSEIVELIVTPEGWATVEQKFPSRGYIRDAEGMRHLRDANNGVQIVFHVSGERYSDGIRDIVFPDPSVVRVTIDGIACVPVPNLVELKLSRQSARWNLKGRADIQQFVETVGLDQNLAGLLCESIRPTYLEVVELAEMNPDLEPS